MLKIKILLTLIIPIQLFAQPVANHYYLVDQKDSLYFLITDNSLMKFYSPEASGEFYMTKYLEKVYPSWVKLMLNDEYLFTTSDNASIYCYSNIGAWDLDLVNVFSTGYPITSMHGFGPYFFIRSGNFYHLFKIANENLVLVEDSLFTQPTSAFVFFTYPYIVRENIVFKYVEGFGLYSVSQININNFNAGMTDNTLVAYFFYILPPPPPPGTVKSVLHRIVIEEPDFQHYIFDGWGMNISELHQEYGTGPLIARKNLYYMTWMGVITTYNSQLAYLPTTEDRVNITDYYIFKLGGDTLRYSKWNAGSIFYDFTWTDYTSVENSDKPVQSFELFQNYPNPFNPSTIIRYEIPERRFVTIKVYDVLGKEISILVNEEKIAGSYEVEFNGNGLASGIYYYRITTGSFSQTKKMIVLK